MKKSTNMIRSTILIVSMLLLLFCFEGLVMAQADYPSKPIKMVVPYNPGGGSDISARTFAKYAEQYLGQPIIVTNITGAGGSVGGQEVLNAAPDGYTLFWHHAALHVSYHTGIADFTWDSFTPICLPARADNCIVVAADAPWDDLDELVDYIKNNPGEAKMGVNIGATTHFIGVGLDIATGGGNINFVAGGGDTDRITKVLGGFTDFSPITVSAAREFVASGDVKPLAVTGTERNAFMPEVPTALEKGYNVVSVFEYGVFGPPGLPQEIADVISKAFKEMTNDEEIIKALKDLAVTPMYLNQDEFKMRLLEEDTNYYRLARFAGLLK